MKRRAAPPRVGNTSQAGEGYYAVMSVEAPAGGRGDAAFIDIYRLSDARHWRAASGAKGTSTRIRGIDSRFVWYDAEAAFYRQALSALGAGDPAP